MLDTGYVSPTLPENQPRRITVEAAIVAWRSWTSEQRIDFGQGVGVAELWDGAIVPAVTNPTAISLVPATKVTA